MWNTLNSILILIEVVGCGTAPPAELTVGPIVSTPSGSQTSNITPTSVSPSSTPQIHLTYYSLSKTVAPQSGFPTKTYTAKGSCVVYQSVKYCWDDGLQHPLIGGYTYSYSYWSLGFDTLNRITICGGSSGADGGCQSDLMTSPRVISGAVASNLSTSSINAVLTTGTPKNVNCTDTNGTLDCGDFQVDLNQLSL